MTAHVRAECRAGHAGMPGDNAHEQPMTMKRSARDHDRGHTGGRANSGDENSTGDDKTMTTRLERAQSTQQPQGGDGTSDPGMTIGSGGGAREQRQDPAANTSERGRMDPVDDRPRTNESRVQHSRVGMRRGEARLGGSECGTEGDVYRLGIGERIATLARDPNETATEGVAERRGVGTGVATHGELSCEIAGRVVDVEDERRGARTMAGRRRCGRHDGMECVTTECATASHGPKSGTYRHIPQNPTQSKSHHRARIATATDTGIDKYKYVWRLARPTNPTTP